MGQLENAALIFNGIVFAIYSTLATALLVKVKCQMQTLPIATITIYYVTTCAKFTNRLVTYILNDESIGLYFEIIDAICIQMNYTNFYYLAFEMVLLYIILESEVYEEKTRKSRKIIIVRTVFIIMLYIILIFTIALIVHKIVQENFDGFEILEKCQMGSKLIQFIMDMTVLTIIIKFFHYFLSRKTESLHQQALTYTPFQKGVIIWIIILLTMNGIDMVSDFILSIYRAFDGTTNPTLEMVLDIQVYLWFPIIDISNSLTFLYLFYVQTDIHKQQQKHQSQSDELIHHKMSTQSLKNLLAKPKSSQTKPSSLNDSNPLIDETCSEENPQSSSNDNPDLDNSELIDSLDVSQNSQFRGFLLSLIAEKKDEISSKKKKKQKGKSPKVNNY